MKFLLVLIVSGMTICFLFFLLVVFYYLRDQYAGSFPFAAPAWWHRLRTWINREAKKDLLHSVIVLFGLYVVGLFLHWLDRNDFIFPHKP
jgi:hypothetical protein